MRVSRRVLTYGKAVWVAVLFTAAVTANLYRGHWESGIILGLFGLWFMCLAMKEAKAMATKDQSKWGRPDKEKPKHRSNG